jgi:hypothetical protein
MDPWSLEIIVVRDRAVDAAGRRALSRDVEHGLLIRLRQGAYVERRAFDAMSPEEQHIVRIRAFAAVSPSPPVFAHWSAGVLLGLPVLRARLTTVHTVVDERRGRGQEEVTAHLFRVTSAELVQVGDVVATGVARTVVDIAGAAPFDEGVMAADAALRSGCPREELERAIVLAGPRRAGTRIRDVVAFAHPGAESAAESGSRVLMLRLGVEPPELQWRVVLSRGSAVFVDFFFPSVRVGGEADGDMKYLDATLAPGGAGPVVLAEKRREDEVRTHLNGLARWGWAESRQLHLMRRVLQRVGVLAATPRATLADYCAQARTARPRFVPRRPPRATLSG